MNLIHTLSSFLQEEIDGSPDVSNTLQDLSSQIRGDLNSLQGISQLITLFVQRSTLSQVEREWLIRRVVEKSQDLPQFKSQTSSLPQPSSLLQSSPPTISLPPVISPPVIENLSGARASRSDFESHSQNLTTILEPILEPTTDLDISMAKSMTVRPLSRSESGLPQMRLVEYDHQELLQDLMTTLINMMEEHIKMTPKIREGFLSRIDHSRHRIEETLNHYGL